MSTGWSIKLSGNDYTGIEIPIVSCTTFASHLALSAPNDSNPFPRVLAEVGRCAPHPYLPPGRPIAGRSGSTYRLHLQQFMRSWAEVMILESPFYLAHCLDSNMAHTLVEIQFAARLSK